MVHVPGTQVLVVAMAGQHQLWRFNLETDTIGVWAGTGREDVGDGPIHTAAFAQPSGLATDGPDVYVADSEGSAVRVVNIKEGIVRTLAGTHDLPMGRSLFAFGDKDGVGDEARLQHCLGVAYGKVDGRETVFIADTYNNKIKACDVRTGEVTTLAGSKSPGDTDDPALFYQPGGLSLAGATLYVADTNNHAIRAIDVKEKTVKTLELEGLAPPSPPRRPPSFPNPLVTDLPKVEAAPAGELTLDVKLPLPANTKLYDAPMHYLVETPGHEGVLSADVRFGQTVETKSPSFSVAVPLARPAQEGDSIELKFSISAFFCNKGSNVCQTKNYVWNVPVTFKKGGAESVALTAKVPAAAPSPSR